VNVGEIKALAFAMPASATHSVAGMTLGPGKVVYTVSRIEEHVP
jgi:hypothetical protein